MTDLALRARRFGRQLVTHTPLEQPARAIWHSLHWRSRHARARIRARNARYDAWTTQVMDRILEPDSNCVDAGAHDGDILAHMVEVAPRGQHVAFEPLPDFAERLRLRFPQVQVHEVALADTTGTASFRYVHGAPSNSGFERRPWDWYDESTVETIEVAVGRLDDLLDPNLRVDFVKIDVEGAELALLRGARWTLARNRPTIVLEVGPHAVEVYDELDSQGFAVWLLDEWLRDASPLTRDGYRRELEQNWYYLAQPRPLSEGGR